MQYFKEKPDAFYALAKEMWPTEGRFSPTASHDFIRELHDKGMLLRCYSQNFDGLEALAGVPPEKLVQAHGSFNGGHVVTGERAGEQVGEEELREAVMRGVPGWHALREKHGGLVKPDIVFFGEQLPARYHSCVTQDFSKCDLLIVMGTSLSVPPFRNLIHHAERSVPRLLINRELVGDFGEEPVRFGRESNYRDAFFGGEAGDVDAGVADLRRELGW